MTVLEMMERAGTKETTLAIAWIKDAMHLIQSNTNDRTKVVKYNVIDGERDYLLPQDLVAIKSISIKDTNDKKYKKIRRIVQDLIVKEDTDPE